MSLKYTEKVQINRQNEIDAYREEIIQVLEDSKQLAMDCDNLVKLRALKSRCDKISKPRVGQSHSDRREYKKQRYEEQREELNNKQREKRQRIREIGQADIGKFFNDVSA